MNNAELFHRWANRVQTARSALKQPKGKSGNVEIARFAGERGWGK